MPFGLCAKLINAKSEYARDASTCNKRNIRLIVYTPTKKKQRKIWGVFSLLQGQIVVVTSFIWVSTREPEQRAKKT